MTTKFITAESGPKNSVIYFDNLGKKWIYEKGSRAWRNQNPGNMVIGKISIENGMIGKAGGFAVFPDYQTGHNALIILLKTEFALFNLNQLMKKYAPPKENKTKKYIIFIKKHTGVSEEVQIKNYSASEFEKLWKAIELMEKWEEGKVIEFSTIGQISKVRKDKKGKIISYLIDGIGWIKKIEAIKLAEENKIDAVVVKRNGTIFLRSRPNKETFDNLENRT
jgi:hypothetical protein